MTHVLEGHKLSEQHLEGHKLSEQHLEGHKLSEQHLVESDGFFKGRTCRILIVKYNDLKEENIVDASGTTTIHFNQAEFFCIERCCYDPLALVYDTKTFFYNGHRQVYDCDLSGISKEEKDKLVKRLMEE